MLIVGYGRVGSVVGRALATQDLSFIVETNPRLVEQLRTEGGERAQVTPPPAAQ